MVYLIPARWIRCLENSNCLISRKVFHSFFKWIVNVFGILTMYIESWWRSSDSLSILAVLVERFGSVSSRYNKRKKYKQTDQLDEWIGSFGFYTPCLREAKVSRFIATLRAKRKFRWFPQIKLKQKNAKTTSFFSAQYRSYKIFRTSNNYHEAIDIDEKWES